MSVEEQLQELDAQMNELREKKQALAKERNEQVARERAETLVAGLSDTERAALAQVVAPDGLDAQMEVGNG